VVQLSLLPEPPCPPLLELAVELPLPPPPSPSWFALDPVQARSAHDRPTNA
jgi:hypothetical protein